MQFARFWRFYFFSNYGSYNAEEKNALSKESEILSLLHTNPWLRKVRQAKPFINEFTPIQCNNSVHSDQLSNINRRLEVILEKLKSLCRDDDQVFSNSQSSLYEDELRTWTTLRTTALLQTETAARSQGQVIHFNTNEEDFHALIASGQKVLWTVDINKALSIGDPVQSKHCIVASGQSVLGAGIAQRKISEEMDIYYTVLHYETIAQAYIREAQDLPIGERRSYLEELVTTKQAEANRLKEQLNGYVPPPHADRRIVLDFDSGHYHPSKAWRPSTVAWESAGYKVSWSKTARFS